MKAVFVGFPILLGVVFITFFCSNLLAKADKQSSKAVEMIIAVEK